MAEKIKENQFDEQGVNPFNAPIPGESLTAAPDMPKAWEQPSQYTDQSKAMEAVYGKFSTGSKTTVMAKGCKLGRKNRTIIT